MTARTCLTLAAVLGFFAVLMGAFGAHGLSDSGFLERQYAETDAKEVAGMSLPASYKYLQDFRTGVRYHMWHSLVLLGVGLLLLRESSKALQAAGWCFAVGTLLFSGSLYVLVIGGPKFGGVTWGMVAPLGGTMLLVAWTLLAVGCWRITTLVDSPQSIS